MFMLIFFLKLCWKTNGRGDSYRQQNDALQGVEGLVGQHDGFLN
jgi:hypothetical protein